MTKTKLIRIPARFYDDHEERDLATPKAIKRTKAGVWIDPDDSAIPELISDARFYSDPYGPRIPGLHTAALALLRALEGRVGQPRTFTDEELARFRCLEKGCSGGEFQIHPGHHLADCSSCWRTYTAEQITGREEG